MSETARRFRPKSATSKRRTPEYRRHVAEQNEVARVNRQKLDAFLAHEPRANVPAISLFGLGLKPDYQDLVVRAFAERVTSGRNSLLFKPGLNPAEEFKAFLGEYYRRLIASPAALKPKEKKIKKGRGRPPDELTLEIRRLVEEEGQTDYEAILSSSFLFAHPGAPPNKHSQKYKAHVTGVRYRLRSYWPHVLPPAKKKKR